MGAPAAPATHLYGRRRVRMPSKGDWALKATFLGQSGWLLDTGSDRIAIDPWLTGNPKAVGRADDLRCNYLLLTHAHDDHIADAAAIARRNDALVITTHEIAADLGGKGLRTHGMHIGGTHAFPFGKLRVTAALHGSGIAGGFPCGFLIETAGRKVYHAGDTALYGDMRLLHELWGPVDLALLPIGGNFTMDADDALVAARWIQPRLVVPMHYDTFPLIAADAAAYCRRCAEAGIAAKVVQPGESIEV
jgi:L-ascorbate metabolism protein UlaG (beta-lactamase superfamily)